MILKRSWGFSERLSLNVSNLATNDVAAFSIDVASGGLTSIGPAVASGDGPTSVTVDSQGRFAYVTNAIAGTVSVFAIDAATGARSRELQPYHSAQVPLR